MKFLEDQCRAVIAIAQERLGKLEGVDVTNKRELAKLRKSLSVAEIKKKITEIKAEKEKLKQEAEAVTAPVEVSPEPEVAKVPDSEGEKAAEEPGTDSGESLGVGKRDVQEPVTGDSDAKKIAQTKEELEEFYRKDREERGVQLKSETLGVANKIRGVGREVVDMGKEMKMGAKEVGSGELLSAAKEETKEGLEQIKEEMRRTNKESPILRWIKGLFGGKKSKTPEVSVEPPESVEIPVPKKEELKDIWDRTEDEQKAQYPPETPSSPEPPVERTLLAPDQRVKAGIAKIESMGLDLDESVAGDLVNLGFDLEDTTENIFGFKSATKIRIPRGNNRRNIEVSRENFKKDVAGLVKELKRREAENK